MLRSWWRQSLVVVLFLLIASCSGGGCSSCTSCGITPIAGGFPPAATITNSASVRVTKHGLDFLSSALPGLAGTLLGRTGGGPGILTFDIPSVPITVAGQTLTVCPNGSSATSSPEKCIAEIEIGNALLKINAVTPDAISLTGTIPVRIQEIQVTGSIIILGNIEIDLGAGSNLSCDTATGGVSPGIGFAQLPIAITLPLVAETIPPRIGYTKIDARGAAVNVTLSSSDLVTCSTDTGIGGTIVNAILGAITGVISGVIGPQIDSVVLGQLQSQLCSKADSTLSPACPTGTVVDDGGALFSADGGVPASEPNCDYKDPPANADAGTCLPIELGLEGRINLGALLSSISPGTSGAVDFALAANGAMIPAPGAAADSNGNTPNGITLGMLGGGTPSPQSDCVPVAANPPPTNLVIPNQMLTDSVTGYGGTAIDGGAPIDAGGGPDLGIAIDRQFLNYFLGSAYNSGLLCLGISTEKFQQLNTGLVSFLIPSMKTLTFEQKAAAIAISTRPQKPPVMTLGGGTDVNTDPTMSIALPSFAIDFYIWSEDRYIRGFTFTADLTVPLNVQGTAAGIQPVIGTLVIANPVVTNNILITDSPTSVASALSGVLGGIVGQLLGSGIGPINLASALSSLGLTFTIPPGGVHTITQTSDAGVTDSYLGLFGNLGTPASPIPQIDTNVTVLGKTVHPEAMGAHSFEPSLAPSLHVAFSSPAAADGTKVEYSWQIDQGTWSAWSTAADVEIRDTMLWMQAKHSLQVTSRIAGVVESQDMTPATAPFTIDALAPQVQVQKKDLGGWNVTAWDVISPTEALVARTRGTDGSGKIGEWSAWMPLAQIETSSANVDVEVRDEEGNIGSVSSGLIRGGPDPTLPTSGGCSSGCSTSAHSGSSWPALVCGLAALSLLFVRRRGVRGGARAGARRGGSAMLALSSIVAVAATSQGCSCGSSAPAGGGGGLTDASTGDGGLDAGLVGQLLCGQGCNQPCGPALPLGLIGAYTSIAQGADGTLWVAGYDDAAVDPANGVESIYGDLVVGKYDPASSSVKWVTVDGLPPTLPDDVCAPNDPSGWRGGVQDSGPDVGLWTSMVLDASGHPMVSYYDSTNQTLKFASSVDGVTWATHSVIPSSASDAGRYSKMMIVNGNPVIAYLVIETGTNGYSRTRVSLAHASKALPASAADWSLEDALVDETSPCRAQDCPAGQACVTSTGVCTAISTGCDAGCSTGNACIASSSNVDACAAIAQSSDIHPYPNAVGDYINMAPVAGGIGLLIYDRIHGNLLGVTNASGSWVATILDGETGSRAAGTAVDTGNDGVGASLFVATNGDWHVSYVDGITEALKYMFVPGGTLVNTLTPQIVDDGSKVDGTPFSDGIHIIGDDSNIRQNADGSITITYMDATVGALRMASGTSAPGAWTLHAFAQANKFGGFFPHFVPGDTTIENWWRWADPTTQVITGNVAIVTP